MGVKAHRDRRSNSSRWATTFIVAAIVIGLLVARHFGWIQSGKNRYEGLVVAVPDGDSLVVVIEGRERRVRLEGIDCPELGQEFGHEARDFARDLAQGRQVQLRTVGVDQYNRILAEVVLQDSRILNQELVRAGCAWHYRKVSDSDELVDLEQAARSAKRGLWQNADPLEPWRWRDQNPRKK